MRPTQRLLVSSILVLLAASAPVFAAEPTYDELKEQLRQLQARVETLERSQAAGSPAAAEIQATREQVRADAERRSALPGNDITAGYDKGFFIKSADDSFTLRPGVLFQFRNVTNIRTGGGGEDESVENGFEIRRLRPRIDGNVFSKDLTYSVVFDVNRNGGQTNLLDAWVQYRFKPTWAVKAGQFRNSWVHEGDVPDYNQLAVERSLVDALLAGSETDRVQGVSLIYGGVPETPLRMELTFDDGDNTKNTNFQDTNADFGASGRVECKFSGDWADYRDFSARTTKKQLLIVGGGVDWSEDAGTDVVRTTADAQFETATGWALYAALNGNVTRNDGIETFDWGGLAQAGYAINPKWEPFARYDVVVLNEAGQTAYNEFAIGVNYFLGKDGSWGHRGKFTLDLFYLPDGAPSDQTGIGVLGSDNQEFVIRGQLQLIL